MITIKPTKLLLALAVSSVCVSAFSYETKVSYSSFYCTYDKSFIDKLRNSQVKFDTHNIKLRGAAAGQPHVSAPGHIDNQPLSILDDYYFETEPDGINNGDVSITVSGVDDSTFKIDCVEGHGDGRKLYGEGSTPAR